MKDFKKENFLKLTDDRKLKVSLDLIYELESSWKNQVDTNLISFDRLKEYLSWMSNLKTLRDLKIQNLLSSLKGDPDLRRLLNIAIAFERHLGISLKDESILVSSKDSDCAKGERKPLYLVLDNLRSAHNVGSIFRIADCLGVSHIYLVGYTATPHDQSVKKTAMGTEEFVEWSHVEKLEDLVCELKSKGILLVALETVEGSENIHDVKTNPGLALFLGNERFGLEPQHLKKMDHIFEIPMEGRKNSLNVSNACAIAVYQISKTWNT